MEEQSIQNKLIQSSLVPSVGTTLANTAKDFLQGVIPNTFFELRRKWILVTSECAGHYTGKNKLGTI